MPPSGSRLGFGRLDAGQKRMNGEVAAFEAVIEMRKQREVSAVTGRAAPAAWSAHNRGPNFCGQNAPGYMPNSLPTQTIRRGGCLGLRRRCDARQRFQSRQRDGDARGFEERAATDVEE